MFWPTGFIGRPERLAMARKNMTIIPLKKHEQMNIKLGMLDPLYYLMFSTNEKISITQIEGNWPQASFSLNGR